MKMKRAILAALVALSSACGSEEPPPKGPEPPAACADEFGSSPGWASSDLAALPSPSCTERASGLWACNKRGKVYDCFDCVGVKTTYDPTDGGAGSLAALGVDDAELAELQKNYDTGCVKQVPWDQYAPDAITRHLLCKEAMAGLKVCANIDNNVQWWFMGGERFERRVVQAAIGNSKGTEHTLSFPAAAETVLDQASYGFLTCEDVVATKNPGWDLWVESDGATRKLVVNLVEPLTAATEPSAEDLGRLNDKFTTCDASYGAWE